MKRILINCSYSDELRVALVDGAKLFDLDNEFNAQSLLKGSIFKATVSRVETSLDAAFVNFGSERHGFLPLKELSNDHFTKDAEGKKKCTLKEGDEILVQVLKEERGTKGAALSNQISLAGRFIVLIPNSEKSGGVSRRISGDERDSFVFDKPYTPTRDRYVSAAPITEVETKSLDGQDLPLWKELHL